MIIFYKIPCQYSKTTCYLLVKFDIINLLKIIQEFNNMDRNRKIKFNILAICLIVLFAFAISPVTMQNDTYYTIKIGEQIIQNGIDMRGPFFLA